MPDLWVDVDTAVVVPVNMLPLTDDTDFKSIEPAVVYNSAGMALTWNFVTTAGASTAIAVTPTTGGVYDWGEPVANQGMYTIEIPASGGASANNNTEGVGWFTGVATGVLPWRGPTIGFRAKVLNDALIAGGDLLDVNTAQWLGTACATPTVAGVPEVDVTYYVGTIIAAPATAGRPDVNVTYWVNTALAVNVAGIPKVDVTYVAGSAATAGLAGKLDVNLFGIKGTALPAEGVAGQDAAGFAKFFDVTTPTSTMNAITWNAAWDAEVESEVNDALVVLKLDHLLAVADADDVVDNSVIAKVASTTGDWSLFVDTTDALQAIRDRGDAAWITAAGFSTFNPASDTVAHVTLVDTTTTNTDMRGTDSVALAEVCTEARLAELDAANLPADIADLPTVAEFNARTLVSADYTVASDVQLSIDLRSYTVTMG